MSESTFINKRAGANYHTLLPASHTAFSSLLLIPALMVIIRRSNHDLNYNTGAWGQGVTILLTLFRPLRDPDAQKRPFKQRISECSTVAKMEKVRGTASEAGRHRETMNKC